MTAFVENMVNQIQWDLVINFIKKQVMQLLVMEIITEELNVTLIIFYIYYIVM